MENKERTQEEFFHTFNALHNANKQIVISSDRPPKRLETLEDRLRNRFEWGLITDIQPPDLETRIAILRKKAAQERLTAPPEVLEFIASKIQTNIRELEGALIRVTAFASLNRQAVDLALAEIVLKDLIPAGGEPEITASARSWRRPRRTSGSRWTTSAARSRSRVLVTARQIAMYLCRELTDLSLPKIGQQFGGRDHTTVMHADRKIRQQMAERRSVYNQVTELTNRIKHQARKSGDRRSGEAVHTAGDNPVDQPADEVGTTCGRPGTNRRSTTDGPPGRPNVAHRNVDEQRPADQRRRPVVHSFHRTYDDAESLYVNDKNATIHNAAPGSTPTSGRLPSCTLRPILPLPAAVHRGGHAVKFRVERDVLAEAVTWVARSLPTRPCVPVLAGMLVEARDGTLLLSGFDYETSARVVVPAQVSDEGSALVSGRLLAEISRSLPAQPVDAPTRVAGSSCPVAVRGSPCRRSRSRTTRRCPTCRPPSGTVKGDVFADAVVAGRDRRRPGRHAAGPHRRAHRDRGRVGHARRDRPVPAGGPRAGAGRRNARTMSAPRWSRPACSPTPRRRSPQPVRGHARARRARVPAPARAWSDSPVTTGGSIRRTTTRLLDGEFPKYRKLFPPEQHTVARVETAPMVESLKRVALVAERNTPMQLTLADGMATLEAGSSDEAQASESLPARIEGEGVATGFNPRYLLDGLSVVRSPVTSSRSPRRPGPPSSRRRTPTPNQPGLPHLLMPVRLPTHRRTPA